MFTFRTRWRWWLLGAIAAVLVVSLAALLLRPMLERTVRARIEAAAVRHGMVARIGLVHVGIWPLLRLEGFDLDLGHGMRLHADMIAATWPGRLRLAVRAATLAGPAGVTVSSPATAWEMAGIPGEDLRLTLVEPQSGLSIHKLAYPAGSAWSIEARGLDVGRLFDVRRDAHPLLDGGIEDGRVDLQASTDALRFHVDMGARGARLGALAGNAAEEPQLGEPTDVTLRFDGAWQPDRGHDRDPRGPRDVGRCRPVGLDLTARSRHRSECRSRTRHAASGLRASAGYIRARGARKLGNGARRRP